MKIQFTRTALRMGWAIEGENVTAKEIREAVQDDMLANLAESFSLMVLEGPLGKFQATNEYMAELAKQTNRIARLFNYRGDYITMEQIDYDPLSR
jgi:hypothetical protein